MKEWEIQAELFLAAVVALWDLFVFCCLEKVYDDNDVHDWSFDAWSVHQSSSSARARLVLPQKTPLQILQALCDDVAHAFKNARESERNLCLVFTDYLKTVWFVFSNHL